MGTTEILIALLWLAGVFGQIVWSSHLENPCQAG